MSERPNTALRVADVDAGIAFYVDALGFALVERDAAHDLAIVSRDDSPYLLAGPSVDDPSRWLSERGEVVKPGATIFFSGGRAENIRSFAETLAGQGAIDLELIEREWGDRSVRLRDPDGYTIEFWTTVERTPEETLALYAAAPDALDAALAGLSDEGQLLRKADGEWSIREIVHHLVDSDATVLFRTKFGLAEPGRTLVGNPYQQDRWATGLAYADRDIAPAVALFRAIRDHMTQLMRTLPDAWTRHTFSPDGARMDAGTMLGMLVSHGYEHIEEIRETRRCHGV